MLNHLQTEKGITLVELLATIVIISIVGALSYSILFQGYSNYQRTKAESELRDEADLIMASLIKDMFVLKDSEIQLDNSCPGSTKKSYLNVTKAGSTPNTYKTGFDGGRTLVKSEEVKFYNSTVQLLPNDCTDNSPTFIEKKSNPLEYNITFTLKLLNGKKEHTMRFENTVQVIENTGGDADDEAN